MTVSPLIQWNEKISNKKFKEKINFHLRNPRESFEQILGIVSKLSFCKHPLAWFSRDIMGLIDVLIVQMIFYHNENELSCGQNLYFMTFTSFKAWSHSFHLNERYKNLIFKWENLSRLSFWAKISIFGYFLTKIIGC